MAMPVNGLLTTYSNVRHKQAEGTLILSPDHVSLQPSNGATSFAVQWKTVAKHQVSPVTHSKALLKLILNDGKSLTFRFKSRKELERARRDITVRLNPRKNSNQQPHHKTNGMSPLHSSSTPSSSSKKRAHSELSKSANSTNFGEMDPTALAVTRSTLLASNPIIRDQHRYLVQESETVSEDDFWQTHQALVEEEYAKICGTTRAGKSSLIQSYLSLQGKVTIGVEEMRQIFIMYPAVHKAFEEKVPLEMSEEVFWKKYLESEFFHRDRGRIGTMQRNFSAALTAAAASNGKNGKNGTDGDGDGNGGSNGGSNGASGSGAAGAASASKEEEEIARAAAVGADDMFGRYEDKLRKESSDLGGGTGGTEHSKKKRWGTHLAVGQFDLASTFETERGKLLEGPRDNYPTTDDEGKGQKVIQKYNRHWAMVLHPDEAKAGSDLLDVARRSVKNDTSDTIREDAKANGGVDREMEQLVKYANAPDANQAQAMGLDEDAMQELNLANIEKYLGSNRRTPTSSKLSKEDAERRCTVFGKAMATKMRQFAENNAREDSNTTGSSIFPATSDGRDLLSHLTKRMAQDAKTEQESSEMLDRLEAEFRSNLETYFRRSSELLRHFYGLRKLNNEKSKTNGGKAKSTNGSNAASAKLARIVQGLEAVYREMEAIGKNLPQNELGEVMRKMFVPIMKQLDWAFQLHRGDSGSGGGGGFVDVEE